jgi:hypothetical protein
MQIFCGGGEFILLTEGSNLVLLKKTIRLRISEIVKKYLTKSADYQFINDCFSPWK